MLSDDKSNLVRGYADNCFTLYLYERPSDDSNVVGHVDRLTELVIDTLGSTDEWCMLKRLKFIFTRGKI